MTLSPALIKAFIIFPLNVMGVIPAFILWYEGKFKLHQLEVVTAISGGVLVACGLVICWVTVSLFTDHGEGTPAPFAPPKKLVVIGFYRYMRNPMMTGVWCVLTGEAIFFQVAWNSAMVYDFFCGVHGSDTALGRAGSREAFWGILPRVQKEGSSLDTVTDSLIITSTFGKIL